MLYSVDPGHPPPKSYTSSEPISNIFTFLESLRQMIMCDQLFFFNTLQLYTFSVYEAQLSRIKGYHAAFWYVFFCPKKGLLFLKFKKTANLT